MRYCLFQIFIIFVTPACSKARHSCYYCAKVYLRTCLVRPSRTPTFMEGFQNYLRQLLSLRTEEGKCHLKHFFLGWLKVKVTLEGHIN